MREQAGGPAGLRGDRTWTRRGRTSSNKLQADEGRRGVTAWRRARRLLAYPRCKQRALGEAPRRHRGQKTLVFVADNEAAYAVAREHLIAPLTCDIGRAERQVVLGAFQAGRLRALVSAQVLNEGIDVPEAEVGIVVGGRLGQREHTQRVGPPLRLAAGNRGAGVRVGGAPERRGGDRPIARWRALLREGDLPLRLLEGRAYLDYLGPQDEPWLRVLLQEMLRHEGRRPRASWRSGWPIRCPAKPPIQAARRHPGAVALVGPEAPRGGRRASNRAHPSVHRRCRFSTRSPRADVPGGRGFPRARGRRGGAGGGTACRPPGERVVRPPAAAALGPSRPPRALNLAVAQAVLMRASVVTIRLEGNARPVVRLAKLRGAHPAAASPELTAAGTAPLRSGSRSSATQCSMAGPWPSLLPHLACCARFELEAAVNPLRGRLVNVVVASGDPIRPAERPAALR